MSVQPVSECSGMVHLEQRIAPQVSAQVATLTMRIRALLGDALLDIVPSYASILFTVNIQRLSIEQACQKVRSLLEQPSEAAPDQPPQCWEIPTYYGPEVALDLPGVGEQCGLPDEEIIQLHCATTYRVYAIGFAPGFCFLGSLDQRLRLPRKATPRPRVPAGSVAIAEQQTAVYPRDTPGGWHIIGRTPQDMLNLCSDPEQPLAVGDELRFVAIGREQFLAHGGCLA